MLLFYKLLWPTLWLSLTAPTAAISPAAIYDGGYDSGNASVQLRIGNGGAGQSGLIQALADAYIQTKVENGSAPFKVAWYESDTTYSIEYLQSNTVDIGITYNPAAEEIAIKQGIAKNPSYYAFRDHFLLAGPPSNPANITTNDDIYTIFETLYAAAMSANTTIPVRFLTRYDKSATNIKESGLWIKIGQVPWATAYSTWYHQYIAFPIQALTAAITLQEYTISDRGTYLSIPPNLQNMTTIYKKATDNASDPLLNPAHILIGNSATYANMAQDFTSWTVSEAGQSVITSFTKNGQQLYSGAPSNDNPILFMQNQS
ncbi:hypothetical protein BDW59DRAFT_176439 [Aspergillus cavernicola]|uniref:PBP domain-containing protein n=1 Tax=Aspergillus cavernicola TaxID=176166 RepID=A0ABR4HG96_9EURO